jgi:hypothetical protein
MAEELVRLAAAARERKAALWAPPVVTAPALSTLIAESERAAALGWSDEKVRARAQRWARWVAGGDAEEATVASLGLRHLLAQTISRQMADFPQACADAPVTGPGVELMRTDGPGFVMAYLHTGIAPVTAYAVPNHAGRPIFMPDGSVRSGALAGRAAPSDSPAARLRALGEHYGLRWVSPERRLETMGLLLREGGICALAIDAVGGGAGRLLGRDVLTSRAPARLAHEAGAPVVVVHGYRWGEQFGVEISAPVDSRQHPSPDALHAHLLALADERLGRDPAQLLVNFPAAELAVCLHRRRELAGEIQQLEQEVARARADVEAAPADPAEGLGRAKRRLKQAKVALKRTRAEDRAIKEGVTL